MSKITEKKVCFNYHNKQQKWQKSHEIAQIYNGKKKGSGNTKNQETKTKLKFLSIVYHLY